MGEETAQERDALQKAYNGVCGVLARLDEAGWADSTLAAEVESVRRQLAAVAFFPELGRAARPVVTTDKDQAHE